MWPILAERFVTEDLALAREVLETEAAAIRGLITRLDERFTQAATLIASCRGRVIVTGLGKSGIIAHKIAATFSSTGTPAYFIHPTEAIHGDLGALQTGDVVVAVSNSGETSELLQLLDSIRQLRARLIALTGHVRSTLGQAADVALDCHIAKEACPLNLAPTASTIASLALGDALAMTVLVRKGFKKEDFAKLHPGGRLGKRLMRVEALMRSGRALPVVGLDTSMRDVIYEMSSKGLGMTCVIEGDTTCMRVAGIITDGDLRRHMTTASNILEQTARDVMTLTPVTIAGSILIADALNIMEERKVTSLIVVDDDRVRGVLHLHDILHAE
jgi:arabinose-5-phosphate isomerase